MAKSYEALKEQHDKIKRTYERISPPGPDDEFESFRSATLQFMAKMDVYLVSRITGETEMHIPEATIVE